MDEDATMRQDLQNIQQQADLITDNTLDSTRRMLQLAEESQEVGVHTLTTLDQQGEQLDRVENGMDQINADIREAERNLTDLEKCCGLCTCPWNRKGNFENSDDHRKGWKTSTDGKVTTKQPIKESSAGGKDKSYITRINENDAREDEMDENLGAVSDILGNLKNMAIDMGNEIETQNTQIDRLNTKANANATRIESADKRAKELIRK